MGQSQPVRVVTGREREQASLSPQLQTGTTPPQQRPAWTLVVISDGVPVEVVDDDR